MTWAQLMIFLVIVAFALLMGGFWIAASLGLAGILGLFVSGSGHIVSAIANIVWNTVNDFTLTAIPLFLFMGDIILVSGLSNNFYRGIAKFLKRIPGGLLHSNIVACAIFAAISGSSVATAAGIGSVAIPVMKERNYKREHIYGSLAAGGTLGILIPPSIPLVIYGSLTSTSVVKLFVAAMTPGLFLAGLYLLFLVVNSFIDKKGYAQVKKDDEFENISWKSALVGVFPMFLLVGLIFGSIYTGYATPTEAAGIGSFIAIVVGKIFGKLKFKQIWDAAKSSVKTTSMIVFIMLGAQIFTYVLTSTGASRAMVSWLTALGLSKWVFLIIVYIIYIFLGCFMDGNSMQFLTLPILFPVLMEYGFNPIWFGIVLVVLIELGQVTPPMGMNLFVINGIDKTSTLKEIIVGVIPYVFIMILMVAILTFFPNLVLFSVT